VFKGMIIVVANEPINSSAYNRGLDRQRISMPFDNFVLPENRRDLMTEFEPELPGLVNWVLSMDHDHARRMVCETDKEVPSLAAAKQGMRHEHNPMALWVHENIEHTGDAKSRVFIGRKKTDRYGNVMDSSKELYANYCHWCIGAGEKLSAIVSLRYFSRLLCDLLKFQLKWEGVDTGIYGHKSYISGVKIRPQDPE